MLVAVGAACVTSGLNLSVSLLLCVMLVAMVKCTTAVAGRVVSGDNANGVCGVT